MHPLHTCCKCKYQWTGWNGNGNGNSNQTSILIPMSATLPLPKRCPKCTSVRWNQRYLDEELALIDRIQDELYETGLIKESGESIEYEGNEALGKEPNRNPSLRFLPGYLNYSASVKIVGFLISNI